MGQCLFLLSSKELTPSFPSSKAKVEHARVAIAARFRGDHLKAAGFRRAYFRDDACRVRDSLRPVRLKLCLPSHASNSLVVLYTRFDLLLDAFLFLAKSDLRKLEIVPRGLSSGDPVAKGGFHF